MQPTTIRLPPTTLEELDSEYAEYGYGDRSEYIRAIIENRNVVAANTETTPERSRPTTSDYERLEERVSALERRLEGESRLEETDATHEVVSWVRENQPVSRSGIVQACYPDDCDVNADTWWRNRAREELKREGFAYTRNVGWREQ